MENGKWKNTDKYYHYTNDGNDKQYDDCQQCIALIGNVCLRQTRNRIKFTYYYYYFSQLITLFTTFMLPNPYS